MFLRRKLLQFTSILVILTILFSSLPMGSVLAQGKDGLKREVNPQTGRVSFLGPENGTSLSASQALGAASPARPADPALALAKRFGSEFGLKSPEHELSPMKTHRAENGRIMARYQQNYQGIPVMGGELIVNTNDSGDLYSMNGEVSPDLSLATQPTIDSEGAKQTALQAAAKWYQKTAEDFVVSEPELWIFDESLLRPSTRPAELVWRMEVKPKDIGMPVRELVLVNAQRGGISLHFNQIDTAWPSLKKTNTAQDTLPTPTPEPTETPLPIETLEPVTTEIPTEETTLKEDISTTKFSAGEAAQTGATWYVATTGNDSNSCSTPASPCATIQGAINKASAGDVVLVAAGIYTGTDIEAVVLINKTINLIGGWDSSFTSQNGVSVIDGQEIRGGIYASYGPTAVIDRFTIQNGKRSYGGGLFNLGTLTISNSTIKHNMAGMDYADPSGAGGGVYSSGTLTLNNSTVNDNLNGGIANMGTVLLNNSTVSTNIGIASYGLYNEGNLTINNSTITRHILSGIRNRLGTVILQNTILAGNGISNGGDCYNELYYNGTVISKGYNLIGNNYQCNSFTPATGDKVGTNASPINPRLTLLQDNGGLTLTHALLTGSPAIDAGNPAASGSGAETCLGTDQRGVARPVGARCDIGAYEGSINWGPAYSVSTYTANFSTSLPGTFLCNQNDPACAVGDIRASAAHEYAIGVYNLYATQFNRNSLDNKGMTIISSINYGTQTDTDEVFWNGSQVVYGYDINHFLVADDIAAHELTHGVTQYESNLFSYYQSGAINEAISDLWGEYFDQMNESANDTAAVKWQIGEDTTSPYIIRSMSNPPAHGQPDKMSSPNYYYRDGYDDGGVHINSGVNNKAVFLMVDGGSFNGKTITALGWDKTLAIYYEVNTNLLSSGANYSDLYYALQQACSNLIGQKGITAGDCAEVKDALDAVEMNAQPVPNFNPNAPYCDAGNPVTTVFADNFESGVGNWTFSNGAYPRWQWDSPYGAYAQSGVHFLYADDYPEAVTDATAKMTSFTVPNNGYLRFAQAYDFETNGGIFYDGGVLEYSTNNGLTWADAGSLIDFNGYKGMIYNGYYPSPTYSNPLKGRSAFVGTSHGYINTRLNLAALAGQTVSFRWRMGLDYAGVAWGWWVDNIQVYTCPVILSKDTTGVFRPSNGLLYLKNSNTTGFADVAINYGLGGDYPVVGDWDGNGTATIGIYRNGKFYLRNSNTLGFADMVFSFGTPGDQPVAGDWDGDGVDTIGVYRPSNGLFLLRNSNSAGAAEMSFFLGNVGDVGIAGDWDGDGKDTTGVFRPINGIIFLKNTNQTGFADIALNYGIPGDKPVTGDWNNDGIDTIGVYRNGQFMLRNSNTVGFADIVFGLGVPGDMPIGGNWDSLP